MTTKPRVNLAQTMSESDLARFWKKVNKAGAIPPRCPELGPCWLWVASLGSHRYGQFYLYVYNRPELAHVISWELVNGIVRPGKELCHYCDIRNCVRPTHMFEGDRLMNMQDAASKGVRLGRPPKLHGHDEVGFLSRSSRVATGV